LIKTPRSFAVLIFCILAAVLIAGGGVFSVERINRERETRALSDAKQLGLAAIQYAQDNKDHYPDAGRWEQELKPYLDPQSRDIFYPLAPIGGTPRRFSLNPAVSGKTFTQTANLNAPWLFYESVSKKPSASDDLDYWPDPNHDGGHLFAVVYTEGYAYPRPPEWKQAVRQHLPGL